MDTFDQRNTWLRQDDAALLGDCDERRFRASGPGGQHRNKVETGVVLFHRPSGLTSQAAESRHQEENRRKALRRLRDTFAIHLRNSFDASAPELPPELTAQRTVDGRLSVNPANPAYPLIVATVLDALIAAGGYAVAANALGLTTSQLVRFLQSDSQVWRTLQNRT